MIKRYSVLFCFVTMVSLAIVNISSASDEAYRDCIDFYGVLPTHPKFKEVQKVCRDVTNTMSEWKGLKRALCASTPDDEKCKEFREKLK